MIDGSEVRARLSGNNERARRHPPTIRKEISDLHQAAEGLDGGAAPQPADDEGGLRPGGDPVRLSARWRPRGTGSTSISNRPATSALVGPESALTLFRVLQEAITNTSPATVARGLPWT